MANRIQLRRDTAANWARVNPILDDGEPGLDIDTNQIKYGDGDTAWNDLAYASGGGGSWFLTTGTGATVSLHDSYNGNMLEASTGTVIQIDSTDGGGGMIFASVPGNMALATTSSVIESIDPLLIFGFGTSIGSAEESENALTLESITFGNAPQSILTPAGDTGTVQIHIVNSLTNNTWTFDTAGKFTLPGLLTLPVTTATPSATITGTVAISDGSGWDPFMDGLQHLVVYINDMWTKVV